MSDSPHSSVAPTPDAKTIDQFCSIVFAGTHGFVPVRALTETGTAVHTPKIEFLAVADLAVRLKGLASRCAEEQRGLYVVPGTFARAGSARAADISETAVILIDLDEGEIAAKRAHLAQFVGQPSLEVASGGTTSGGQAKLHLYASEPPAFNRRYLESRLAYRIQELAYGGLKPETVKRLEALGEQLDGGDRVKSRIRADLRPIAGTRLLRDWQGVEQVVTVLVDGFEWQGRPYKSLSAIARAITGTRWSGWVFFGLSRGGRKASRGSSGASAVAKARSASGGRGE